MALNDEPEYKCDDFAAEKCHRDEYHLEKLDRPTPTEDLCQIFCESYASCLYWRYDRKTGRCEMYNGDCGQHCEEYAGTTVCKCYIYLKFSPFENRTRRNLCRLKFQYYFILGDHT